MIGYFSTTGRKKTAWLLFFLFYFQLTGFAYSSMLQFFVVKQPIENFIVSSKLVNRWNGNAVKKEVMHSPNEKQNEIVIKEQIKSNVITVPDKSVLLNIGGPGQPEMRSFKSVGSDNMVNDFTGDFSYNIPLIDVGGYPVNLFYNAGIVMEQEASWVGLGWNLNPGAVSRSKRGLPDDFNGNASMHDADVVVKEQNLKDDVTVGASLGYNLEVIGLPGNIELKPNVSGGVFWNNRRGLGLQVGGDYSFQKKIASGSKGPKTSFTPALTLGANLNSQSGASIDFGAEVTYDEVSENVKNGLSTSIDYNSRTGLGELKIDVISSKDKCVDGKEVNQSGRINYASISFARSSYTPSIRMPMTRMNAYLQIKLGGAKTILHSNAVISGSLSTSHIHKDDNIQTKPAFGYMYYQEANDNPDALLDFNRMNDGVYTKKTPLISIPEYTYDVFSINGEGTGGSFRGYRGNLGYIRDHYSKSKTGSFNLALDAGVGNIVHAGVDGVGALYSTSQAGEWEYNNAMRENTKFNQSESDYEGFYFKNPGEKTIMDEVFYDACGGDKLIRPKLASVDRPMPFLASEMEVFGADRKKINDIPVSIQGSRRNVRDKRTQIITHLSAEEASRVGLQKQIVSYDENVFKSVNCNHYTLIKRSDPGNPEYKRKPHHLSEIDVLEADGKRYVFGLPVYNESQRDVTFSIEAGQGNWLTQLTNINADQNSTSNKSGKDHFFQRETVSGFAHSFLLTGILSPDYVDITGDGITDDDMGNAIKFNYTRVNKYTTNGGHSWHNQKWRTPYEPSTAHFNPGLRSDNGDDKGLYTYGVKELWYTHSIETKNMIATFVLSERRDAHSVQNENGGISNIGNQRKLERIDLYTKAEFLKPEPVPVKTVHFSYSYKLCPNTPSNNHQPEIVNTVNVNAAHGKLTLESVWFSYNGNERQVKNKYKFKYAENKTISLPAGNEVINCNPGYNPTQTDRWGLFKPNASNPNGLLNMDYPYALQGEVNIQRNNAYASAWNLEKILLPSGSVISVDYEVDDYGFVQNKPAMQMTKIVGFGKNSGEITDQLYDFDILKFAHPGDMDCNFVFFDVDEIVNNKQEIAAKYLAGFKQLLMKIWVLMPKDTYGEGTYEPINIYGTIKDYDVDPNNNKRFWVELNKSSTGGSQIMETVLQFVKDYLPSKVYKGYDIREEPALRQIVYAIKGLGTAYFQALEGFEFNLKSRSKCRIVDLNFSFARLANPIRKKQGGGHRVKRITISDNWKKMSDPSSNNTIQVSSFYGQEYDYTKIENEKIISSGVTTYEPGVGGEENPFREILQYNEKQPLGPNNHINIELPVTETFFPSPQVGYSKVTVRSIHNKSNKNIKSGVGKQVTEYYTCREFPVITDYTDFDGNSRSHFKPKALVKILFNYSQDMLTLSQGFRVILNDMNGKIKSHASYPEGDDQNPVNATTYNYKTIKTGSNTYRPSNIVPAVLSSQGIINNKLIGKDIEVMTDFRSHIANTNSIQIPGNLEGFVAVFPIVLLNILHMRYSDITMYHSAVTLKVVHEYGILESIENVDKGSHITTNNIVYDAETGDPIVSSVTNAFRKPVYSFNYPAHWVNSGMSLAYKNIDLTFRNVFFKNGRVHNSPQVDMNKFESGDEIYVVPGNSDAIPIAACVSAGFSSLSLPVTSEFRIWAIDVTKDIANPDKSFIFLDRFGTPYNGDVGYMRVIRSGKRNMVGASVGSITCLNNPVVTESGITKIKIDNTSKVINASAIEFKENWKVADALYKEDITQWYDRYVPLHDFELAYDLDKSLSMTDDGCVNCGEHFHIEPQHTLAVRKVVFGYGNHDYKRREHQSFIKFKLDDLVNGATIKTAKLSLKAHVFQQGHHALAYFNPHYGGPGDIHHDIHQGNVPHTSSPTPNLNGFIVSKLPNSWPVNDDAFRSAFYFTPSTPGEFVYVPPPINNVYNYTLEGGSNFDTRIDVKTIVQKMQQEKSIFGINYTSGVKLSIPIPFSQTVHREIRLCFGGDIVSQGGPGSKQLESNLRSVISPSFNPTYFNNSFDPVINGTYYKCDEALPYGSPEPVSPHDVCRFYETNPQCLSHFNRSRINFYALGLLGNWKPWRSYVYYGERNEKDPLSSTDLSNNGIINNFENFWTLAPDFIQKTNSDKWVWNTEITQSNKKGLEIENHDPLGRYNSGIYGFQETLPIAVANNARVREIAYDGFEDYSYNDQQCPKFCSPFKRHLDFPNISNYISTEAHHTGKSSLKISGTDSYVLQTPVLLNDEIYSPTLQLQLLNNSFSNASATLTGTGLTPRYYSTSDLTGPYIQTVPELPNLLLKALATVPPSCNSTMANPPTGCTNISAEWNGSIVTAFSGDYQFAVTGSNGYADDAADVSINSTLVASSILSTSTSTNGTFHLEAGQAYAIRITYRQTTGMGQLQFKWRMANTTNPYTPIPIQNLYPVGSLIPPAVTELGSCAAPGDVKSTAHTFIDKFSLISNRKYIMSAWVREGINDCNCDNYTSNNIEIKADGVSITGTPQVPKGKIIEGWQRYEFSFTVPANTLSLEFFLRSSANTNSYFDDIRIHPFESNLKSYVYNPESLRLGADLDENNFATFYEYDDEGTLVRVKKETKDGIKTISETRSAIQKNIQDF